MAKLSTLDKVSRLIAYALGDSYGDGEIVSDIAIGYAEPGYGRIIGIADDEIGKDVVVFGNWNDKTWYDADTNVFHVVRDLPSRLARSLERVGAEIEWSDEWASCGGCYRAVRTSPDSYSWRASFTVTDGELLCHDCLTDMGEDGLSDYINNATNCVTWCEPSHVESLGYVQYKPGDPQFYENGFHPGQDDDPKVILDEILDADPSASVVFFLNSTGQFDMTFSAYVKVSAD